MSGRREKMQLPWRERSFSFPFTPRCPMSRHCLNCILPPHLLEKLLENKDRSLRDLALNTMLVTSQLRGERNATRGMTLASAAGDGRRTIFDCRNAEDTEGAVVMRTEDGDPSSDDAVNRAFDGLG